MTVSWGMKLLGVGEKRLVLASSSPRRSAILNELGVRFEVLPVDVDESLDAGTDAAEGAVWLAQAKARAAAESLRAEPDAGGDVLVVAADTLVVQDGRALGKPRDEAHARRMLGILSGTDHTVVTGVAVLRMADGALFTGTEHTVVHFRELEDEDVEALVASGECMDKAGAYGIQGLASLMVEEIEGDYFNVVGLPLGLLRRLLRDAGRVDGGNAG